MGILKNFWIWVVCKLIVKRWLILVIFSMFVMSFEVIGLWECVLWFWWVYL